MTDEARTADDRRCAAYHEAGHAVIRVDLRLAFHKVTIVPDDESEGHVEPGRAFRTPPEYRQGARFRDAVERNVKAGLAGVAATQELLGQGTYVEQGDWDSRRVLDFLELLVPLGDSEIVDAYMRLLDLRTRRLVTHWSNRVAIEAVAAALLERNTLTGREVRAIVFDARRKHIEASRSPRPPA